MATFTVYRSRFHAHTISSKVIPIILWIQSLHKHVTLSFWSEKESQISAVWRLRLNSNNSGRYLLRLNKKNLSIFPVSFLQHQLNLQEKKTCFYRWYSLNELMLNVHTIMFVILKYRLAVGHNFSEIVYDDRIRL